MFVKQFRTCSQRCSQTKFFTQNHKRNYSRTNMFMNGTKSLRDALKSTSVQEILSKKKSIVQMVEKSVPTLDAVKLMSKMDIGAVVVKDDTSKQEVGMFTERDYIYKLVLLGRSSKDTPISDVMTNYVMVVGPHFSLDECAALMIQKQIRHLPVSKFIGDSIDQDARVVALISCSDLIKTINDTAQQSRSIPVLEETIAKAVQPLIKMTAESGLGINDTVYSALELMKKLNTGGVFVKDGASVAGVFSERDYLHKIILQNRSSKTTKLGEVMNKEGGRVSPDSKVKDLISAVSKHRAVPVINSQKSPVGLFTALNVLEFLHSLK